MRLSKECAKRSLLAVLAVPVATMVIAGTASADTIAINNWTLLNSSASTYGQYYAQPNRVAFRWRVDTAHSTRVSANNCANYNDAYGIVDFGAHVQEYANIWANPGGGQCFALRGRSLYGTQSNLAGYLIGVYIT